MEEHLINRKNIYQM